MEIKYLVFTDSYLLSVFYTDAQCWQYSLVFKDNSFYCPHEIFDSSNAAYLEAREAPRNVMALKKMYEN